jgi:hypothetical protein
MSAHCKALKPSERTRLLADSVKDDVAEYKPLL